ncbi:MAG: ATP-binding cassette domain-containing protein [Bdellovibrionaceae bacterium]|nr:ATP-binding cassette domain-containing protein [Bdellovibrio sp.]
MPSSETASFIEFKNISKVFDEHFACRDISLKIQRGTVHALVGENGAGKSTLMKILGGLLPATSGTILLSEKIYQPTSAQEAFQNYIAFIHQHFVLADNLTALDNLVLSSSTAGSVLQKKPMQQIRQKAHALLKKFSWTIDLDKVVYKLSIGQQQRLEILKALLQSPEIIIFDEPTAVLTPQEATELLHFILELKTQGKTIILISHKLHEIKKVADNISILRHGELVFTDAANSISVSEIAEKMIGRRLESHQRASGHMTKKVIFQWGNENISLMKGEIFGVAGVEGNGQNELISKMLNELRQQKLSYGDISEDRVRLSVFENLSLTEHMLLKHPHEFVSNGVIQKERLEAATAELLARWDVRPGVVTQPLHELSGGNQQKFIVGRELWNEPKILLAAHPTRGVDLGAQQKIHEALHEYKKLNAVFLVSSDLDEVIGLADRYIVLYKNKIFGPFQKNELNEMQIGLYMAGGVS